MVLICARQEAERRDAAAGAASSFEHPWAVASFGLILKSRLLFQFGLCPGYGMRFVCCHVEYIY